ncbi:unnamed protein product, partial [Phaeothamnion confervicola]
LAAEKAEEKARLAAEKAEEKVKLAEEKARLAAEKAEEKARLAAEEKASLKLDYEIRLIKTEMSREALLAAANSKYLALTRSRNICGAVELWAQMYRLGLKKKGEKSPPPGVSLEFHRVFLSLDSGLFVAATLMICRGLQNPSPTPSFARPSSCSLKAPLGMRARIAHSSGTS